jgi:hypothetical protein
MIPTFFPERMSVDNYLVTSLPLAITEEEIKSDPDLLEISEEKTDVSR